MNSIDIINYISDKYQIGPEYLWEKSPDCAVFRSPSKKWFALIMSVSNNHLGILVSGNTTLLNLKSSPLMIGSLISSGRYLPAYHMNKTHWISAILDDKANVEELKFLIDLSYQLTLK